MRARGSTGVRMVAAYEEFDPERVFLGLSHHESASGHDRPSLQQPKAFGHKHDLNRGVEHNHALLSGGFRLAGARVHPVLARSHSGTLVRIIYNVFLATSGKTHSYELINYRFFRGHIPVLFFLILILRHASIAIGMRKGGP